MALLFSAPTEAVALRSLCSSDIKISGALLAGLTSSYFYTEEGKEVFQHVTAFFGRKGLPPSWKLMCEDLGLSEDAREFLRSADGVAKSTAQVDQLVNGLNKYRQTRVYYKMAKALLRNLELPKIDPDELNELIGKALSSAQLRKAELAEVINIGRDSNVREILEKVIYSEDTTNCIPTGFKTFDSVNGGFFRGSLCSLAGNTGSGKCSRPDTLVTLSTLVLTLEDGSCLEFEPEDKLTVTREGATVEIQALDLLPGDDLVNHSLADE